MSRFFYFRFALSNMRKNKRLYVPFALAVTGAVMMFYILHSIIQSKNMGDIYAGLQLKSILQLGLVIMAVFSSIFLFYTSQFLMKQRKKELGLYNILGMGKQHIAQLLLIENAILYVACMGTGLLCGLAMSKLLFFVLLKITAFAVPLRFAVEGSSILTTLLFFLAAFTATYLFQMGQVQRAKTIELLQSAQAGEREPRARWLLAAAGVIATGYGYYLALSIESPLQAIMRFFFAVILVILGTYALFTAGSVMFLKAMRRNKQYFYQTKHFVGVSGMIHRMKQNAVGLANICVLSAMVLVLLSTTACLYAGQRGTVESRFPRQAQAILWESGLEDSREIEQLIEEQHVGKASAENVVSFPYITYETTQEGTDFSGNSSAGKEPDRQLFFMTVEDYNKAEGTDYKLMPGQILIYGNQNPYGWDTFTILGDTFEVKRNLNDFTFGSFESMGAYKSYFVVLPSEQQLADLAQRTAAETSDAAAIRTYSGFDLEEGSTESDVLLEQISEIIRQQYPQVRMDNIWSFQSSTLALYGGLLFIGSFLGVLFLMAAVMIIYYKQVSEGYEDRQRFQIMKKVGMNDREIRASIRSQVMIVFFLPLAVAVIHVAAAFPMISKLLALLSMTDIPLFLLCSGASALVFTLIYSFVYFMTAKTYYKIVE